MIFVWGSKQVERKQGLVADFCPVCRNLRAFELIRVGIAGHIYYVAFGEGKLAGYLIRCTDCSVGLQASPVQYLTPQKGRPSDLERLIHMTFPNLRSAYAERLEIEEKLKRNPSAVSPEQRKAFLIEPFGLLNYLVEERYGNSSQFDRQSGIGCLATLAIGGLLIGTAFLPRGIKDQVGLAVLVLFGLGTIYTFVQLHFAPKRFTKTKVLPVLARALDPLEPTSVEIKECLERCKSTSMKIASALKPEQVWQELQRRATRLSQ